MWTPNDSRAVKTTRINVTLLARVVNLDAIPLARVEREPLALGEFLRIEDSLPVLVDPT